MKNIVFALSLVGLVSCSTQTVAVDYDRNQNFQEIKEYRFEIAENSMGELDLKRIQSAIENELSTKGMSLQETAANQIKILPAEYISKTQDSSIGVGVGGGSHGFGTSIGFGIPINSEKLNQKYLISIYNERGEMVWEGRLEIQMPANASPETREESIVKGVRKLFINYPPKSK